MAVDGGAHRFAQGLRWVWRKQPFTASELYAVAFVMALVTAIGAI